MSDPDYICDYCSRSFTRKYNLQTHIENCHLNLSCYCEICDQGFGSPTGLFLHLNRGHNSNGKSFPECDICGRIFTRRQNIISHMKTVHLLTNSYFPCTVCNKTFTTARNMKRHIKMLHDPDIQYFSCNECKKVFKGKKSLISHIKSNHNAKGLIKCLVCNKIFTSNKNLKRHREYSHGEKGVYRCTLCPKVYTSNQSLRRHSKTQHTAESISQYTCEYCFKHFYGRQNFDSHMEMDHKEVSNDILDVKDAIHCEICNELYNREYLLRQHIKTEHTFQEFYDYCRRALIRSDKKLRKIKSMKECLHTCEYCHQVFSSVTVLKDHLQRIHRDCRLSTCNVCFENFLSIDTLREHKKICIPPKNVHSCSHCDKLFTDVSSLEFHLRIFHPQAQVADSNNTFDESESSYKAYKCVHCEKIYYNKHSFNEHVKFKHSNVQVKCLICSKNCLNKYDLLCHMKMKHSDCDDQNALYIQCVECGMSFKEKRSLRKHIRTKHPNSTAFSRCHICGKHFESTKSCETHTKLHASNTNSNICMYCSVSFTDIEALNVHLSTNHLAAEEKYSCLECNIVFEGQQYYDEHFKICHSDTNIQSIDKISPRCIICMKDFSTRKTLKRHIKKFHTEFNVDEFVAYSGKHLYPVECSDCIRNFNDDFYYDIYLKVKHMKESIIFKCELCNGAYNTFEYSIQRYKQSYDLSQSKVYLSGLCTTEMSDGSSNSLDEDEETETATKYLETEVFGNMLPESAASEFSLEPFIKVDDIKVEIDFG